MAPTNLIAFKSGHLEKFTLSVQRCGWLVSYIILWNNKGVKIGAIVEINHFIEQYISVLTLSLELSENPITNYHSCLLPHEGKAVIIMQVLFSFFLRQNIQ